MRIFEEFYEPVAVKKDRKKNAKEEHYKQSWLPHYSKRLYYSVPNVSLNLKIADEVDNHQNVFRMNLEKNKKN